MMTTCGHDPPRQGQLSHQALPLLFASQVSDHFPPWARPLFKTFLKGGPFNYYYYFLISKESEL